MYNSNENEYYAGRNKDPQGIEQAHNAQDQKDGFVAGHQTDSAFPLPAIHFNGNIGQGVAAIQQDEGARGGEGESVSAKMQITADDVFAEDPQTGI